jgi:hypothetical protein
VAGGGLERKGRFGDKLKELKELKEVFVIVRAIFRV